MSNLIEKAQQVLNFSDSDFIRAVIEERFIIGYGTVTAIPCEGAVTVLMSVAKNYESVVSVNCPYFWLATGSLAIDVAPSVGDKVLVLSPQFFSMGMFTKEQKDTIINPNAYGYSPLAGIAVPLCMNIEGEYNNVVKIENGTLTAKLAYKADKNNAEVSIDSDGAVTYKNPNGDLSLDKDGAFSFNNKKASVQIDKDGNISIKTNGKLSISNESGKSLYTVLKGILGILNSSLATFGSPANHTVVAGQFQTQEADLDTLME